MEIIYRIVLWVVVFCHYTRSQEDNCNNKLGMESGRIPDESITASSSNSDHHAPSFARIDNDNAWCSAPEDKSPYIEILLDEQKFITSITTQGSSSNWSWARKYEVKYFEKGKWKAYKEELTGNGNSRALNTNKLNPAITTRKIRIYPKEPYSVMLDPADPVPSCLRLELHGCSAPADCKDPGSPPNGLRSGNNFGHGKQITFACVKGFILVGSTTSICLKGTWTHALPSCKDYRRHRATGINLAANTGLDLVFVIDSTKRVRRTDFLTGLRFAKKLVRTIGARKRADGSRIAAVSFGFDAILEFNLGDANADTMEKAIEAIDKIMYVGGSARPRLAFEMVRRVILPQARLDSQRVMIFITGGMSNIGGPSQKEAKRFREEDNFEIYAIVVGKRVRVRVLMDIASADDYHVISVRRYKTLQEAIMKIVYTKVDYSPCGVSPVDFRARMVGGRNSKRGWWPWQIGLYKLNDKVPPEFQLICGGALISRRWILTAASCFYHFHEIFGTYRFVSNTGEYLVKIGDHNLLRKERSQQDIRPERVFVHEDYVERRFVNDIALIKLKDKVELGPFVRTLCLPEKDEGDLAIPMKYGFTTGWGATQALKPGEQPEPGNKYSTRLQYSAFTIQSDELCANRSVIAVNSTVAFCAGDGKGGNDTCHGDSGGAFVRQGKRGESYRWVAIGLVSWGLGCPQKDQYGYYTRVYPFTDWIKNTIEENTEADD